MNIILILFKGVEKQVNPQVWACKSIESAIEFINTKANEYNLTQKSILINEDDEVDYELVRKSIEYVNNKYGSEEDIMNIDKTVEQYMNLKEDSTELAGDVRCEDAEGNSYYFVMFQKPIL